jgi:pimeloyl-ACP methyl ester carboxylesterase
MFVRENGDGPPVLLIPGCPMPAEHFMELIDELATDHRVFAPDLPGYGKTAALADDHLNRTTELLERTLLDRGVSHMSIVGASLGAYRGAALAASGRLRVTALYSIGGFVALPDDARAAFAQFAAAVRGGHVRVLEEVFVSRMLSAGFCSRHRDVVEMVTSWLYLTSPEVLADELAAIAELPDLRPRLRDLPTRVVARVGELDAAAPPALSEALVHASKHAALEVVPACGHLLLLEDRASTVASIRRCLG